MKSFILAYKDENGCIVANDFETVVAAEAQAECALLRFEGDAEVFIYQLVKRATLKKSIVFDGGLTTAPNGNH